MAIVLVATVSGRAKILVLPPETNNDGNDWDNNGNSHRLPGTDKAAAAVQGC